MTKSVKYLVGRRKLSVRSKAILKRDPIDDRAGASDEAQPTLHWSFASEPGESRQVHPDISYVSRARDDATMVHRDEITDVSLTRASAYV